MSSSSQLIPIGQLGKTHGLTGEIRFRPYRPFFSALLTPHQSILVGTRQLTLTRSREAVSHMLLVFEGVNSPELAQIHVNQELYFPIEAVEAITPTPTQFPEQWLGWAVVSGDEILGTVVDILQTRANDILTVKGTNEEWLVPVIPEYILSSVPETKTLTVKKPIFV